MRLIVKPLIFKKTGTVKTWFLFLQVLNLTLFSGMCRKSGTNFPIKCCLAGRRRIQKPVLIFIVQ